MWPFTRAKEEDGSDAKAPREPTVDLLDHAAVKRALDDALAEAILDAGAEEDLRLFNWKLGLGVAACVFLFSFLGGGPCLDRHVACSALPHACTITNHHPPPRSHSCLVALLAQFYPGKPPATAPLLAGCVATYVVLSLVSAAFATWVERDAFLVTRSQVRASE
jgi:hypothetical protein